MRWREDKTIFGQRADDISYGRGGFGESGAGEDKETAARDLLSEHTTSGRVECSFIATQARATTSLARSIQLCSQY